MTLIRTASISAFLFVLILFLMATNEKKIRELVMTKIPDSIMERLVVLPPRPRQKSITFPEIIDLPEHGDFTAKNPKPKKRPKKIVKAKKKAAKIKKKISPKPKPEPAQVRKQKVGVPAAAPHPPKDSKTEDTRPLLDFGYTNVGLKDYLRMAESIGRFYLLVQKEKSLRLGPMISFKNDTLDTGEQEKSYRDRHLAVKRPYLVTDPELRRYLAGFSVPDFALSDQLALFLNKPFDKILWDGLEEDLRKKKYRLSDIKSVNGQYLRHGRKSFIRISEATTKSDKKIEIGRQIKLPCGACL